jgi:DNA-binding MarR family transcriptional regulator
MVSFEEGVEIALKDEIPLTVRQLGVLMKLWNGPATMSAIAVSLNSSFPVTSAAARRLEFEIIPPMIKRLRRNRDRRLLTAELTDEGRAYMSRYYP